MLQAALIMAVGFASAARARQLAKAPPPCSASAGKEISDSHRWARCEGHTRACDESGDGRSGCCCDDGFAPNEDDECDPCCSGQCERNVTEIRSSHRWAECGSSAHRCDASGDGREGCCCNEGFRANEDDSCVLCCGVAEDVVTFTVPPKCLAAMAVGAVGSIVAAPIILGIAGFGSAGVAGGSLAALWQSTMAGVASGSFFSTLQAIAMGGLSTSGAVSLGGAAASGALAFCKGFDDLVGS